MTHSAVRFSAWLDDFFAAYYRRRPVNATFIGEHAYDHRLPDFSEQGAGDCLAEMQDLLARLDALPEERLTTAQQIDRTLAAGFLRIQCWEYASAHFHRGNPSHYTGEAIFGILGLFLTPYAPFAAQRAAAVERLQQIPELLAQGKANVRTAPQPWTERARRECRGAQALFGDGIDQLLIHHGVEDAALRTAADRAAAAFAAFDEYLRHELMTQPNDAYACGPEAFALHMRDGHCLDMSGAEIVAYAEEAWEEANGYLVDHAAEFGAATPAAALAQLAEAHPSPQTYYARYTELWQACRTAASEHNLISWPDFPIQYVPRPQWVRAAAPDLYFLFYRSPAAVNRPPVHQYLVEPLAPDLTSDQQSAFLRSNNDSVIKLNHVVHHGAIGHHVQNWYAFHAESRIGRVAAVDCAARIAMFCGGSMAEGWACYATDLMGEIGFYTPLERYAESQSRRRMSTRAIVDVKLHSGEFTLDEAAACYVARAGMSPQAAFNEAVKNSMFPGAAMMYLLGTDGIHDLRREAARRAGNAFNLARFHEQLLAYGSIPVPLVRKAVFEREWATG